MNTKNVIKKIIAVVGISMIGATLVGCGVSTEDFNAKVNELASAQELLVQAQDASANLEITNDALVEQVASQGIVIEETNTMVEGMSAELEVLKQVEEEVMAEEEAEASLEEVKDGLVLGDSVGDFSVDHYDVDFLYKGDIDFKDEEYKVKEYISLSDLKVGISDDDADFEDVARLLFTASQGVTYSYEFEEVIDYSDIKEDEQLYVSFLGKEYEIVDVKDAELTYKENVEKANLLAGEEYIFDEVVVRLNYVTEDKASVTVGIVTQAIELGETEEFAEFEVRVNDIDFQGYAGGVEGAELEFGTDILQTVDHGDEFIEDNEDYTWNIITNAGDLVSIGVTYDVKADDLDEAILAPGESLNFLDYFKLGFDYEKVYDYAEYELSFDEITSEDYKVVKVEANGDFITIGDEKMSEAYFDGTLAWYKEDGDWINSTEDLVLENDEKTLTMKYDGNHVKVGAMWMATSNLEYLGLEEGEAETADIVVGGIELGTTDESYLKSNGIVVESPEDNADNDKMVLRVPNEKVFGMLTVSK